MTTTTRSITIETSALGETDIKREAMDLLKASHVNGNTKAVTLTFTEESETDAPVQHDGGSIETTEPETPDTHSPTDELAPPESHRTGDLTPLGWLQRGHKPNELARLMALSHREWFTSADASKLLGEERLNDGSAHLSLLWRNGCARKRPHHGKRWRFEYRLTDEADTAIRAQIERAGAGEGE